MKYFNLDLIVRFIINESFQINDKINIYGIN